MSLTMQDLDGPVWIETSHYNLGKGGNGYGYQHKTDARVSCISYSYRGARRQKEDKPGEIKWFVDGNEVADKEEVIRALVAPPVLTDDEKAALARVPVDFVDLRPFETELAGVPHPDGPIEPNTPHTRVLDLLRGLAAKGAIEYGRRADISATHMSPRSIPTIRRCTNSPKS